MKVIGHTDNRGTYEKNVFLSQQRSEAVKSYLLKKLSIENIVTEGKADEIPVADNVSDAGRAANRKVQIVVSYWSRENEGRLWLISFLISFGYIFFYLIIIILLQFVQVFYIRLLISKNGWVIPIAGLMFFVQAELAGMRCHP